jgi:hypothetical protein
MSTIGPFALIRRMLGHMTAKETCNSVGFDKTVSIKRGCNPVAGGSGPARKLNYSLVLLELGSSLAV